VTSIIYCRMAWSTSKLNTRKYNNISLIRWSGEMESDPKGPAAQLLRA